LVKLEVTKLNMSLDVTPTTPEAAWLLTVPAHSQQARHYPGGWSAKQTPCQTHPTAVQGCIQVLDTYVAKNQMEL
jgi:hypothetical protein